MFDFRPIGYVIGLLVATLGGFMVLPMLLELTYGQGQWEVFAESAIISVLCGGMLALACSNGVGQGMNIRQTFLLTTAVWIALPLFGALPFIIGETEASFTDAFFEAVSGLTTTGSTVFSGLEQMSRGLLLWRGILQWLGGIGIIVVAMVFLPELRVGGMQIFKSEGFDTFGKILPRATEIASRIFVIYFSITALAGFFYLAAGLNTFDSIVHAMTTVATGGLANYDASFAALPPAADFVAIVFMLLAALPFVRYVQIVSGSPNAIFQDSQVRGFLFTLVTLAAIMVIYLWIDNGVTFDAFRRALFNVTSIMTGTGYANDDYMTWGPFAVTMFFFIGLIGGCAGSTTCSIKIFRYQLLFASVRAQVRKIHSPHGVFTPRYDGRTVSDDVLSSVMSFFVFFVVTLGVVAVALGMAGLDFITSVSGAAASLANIGPGLGSEIGPAGNYAGLNDTAKWILVVSMLLGRLELLAVFVLFTSRFWRA